LQNRCSLAQEDPGDPGSRTVTRGSTGRPPTPPPASLHAHARVGLIPASSYINGDTSRFTQSVGSFWTT